MEATSLTLRCAFIFFTALFLLFLSWHPLNNSDIFYTTSKNRIRTKFGSVLEHGFHKPKNHLKDNPCHPLDPLTVQEINKVRTVLSSYEPFLSNFPALHSVSLDEITSIILHVKFSFEPILQNAKRISMSYIGFT